MTLYRGANKGIIEMIGGSYYSNDYEIAQSYADLEENGEVYEFNPIINILDVDDILFSSEMDEGMVSIREGLSDFESIFEKYDGISIQNGVQIMLFGTLDIYDNFEKQSLVDLMNDATINTRRYDR